ncbi:peroxiredoxin family protein [Paraflavitalea pollutisoli]|uniref:peroxiredoxin family protein n=1 Tax=Paraflavitalea pollutisoli TaxID=3034143 RepID=UPI0023EDE836|nr:TlpA disulfide reductase family protein [Paraflavitalea sp. H1-2-19X]
MLYRQLFIAAFTIVLLSGLFSLPVAAQSGTNASDKPLTYLLPDGRIFNPSKIDSLEQAWGTGRIAFDHTTADDEKGIIHVVRLTDEMVKASNERREAERRALNNMLHRPAPDFTLTDLQGKAWSLASLKGKIVVLNFWFTSCGPCIKEMPDLNKLTRQYDAREVVFLAITFNDADQVRAFQQRVAFDYTLLPAARATINDYKITNYPTSLVIDQQGVVKKIQQGGANIEETLTTAIDSLNRK